MPIPSPTPTNPILHHERKVWVKGFATDGLFVNGNPGAMLGRNAARPYALSHVFAGAGIFPYAVLYTPTPLTYTALYLVKCYVFIESVSAAAIVNAQLISINSPPTGGTAVVPASIGPTASGFATLGMVLPTGGANALAVARQIEYNVGITGGVSVANPPPNVPYIELFEARNPMIPLPKAIAASSGWMVRLDVSAACTVVAEVYFEFLEQT